MIAGADSSANPPSSFFSSNAPVNLSAYLATLGNLLAPLSRPDELSAAFAAFDLDDSGQVDVTELRAALLNCDSDGAQMSARQVDDVLGGFSGRRAFGRTGGRGEVFRYREFVGGLGGSEQRDGEAVEA